MKVDDLRKQIAEDEKKGRSDGIFWMKVLTLQLRYLNKKLDEITEKTNYSPIGNKAVNKIDYCNCVYHYVCYGGYVCMNRGCGKLHQFVSELPKKKRDEIFSNLEDCMVHNEKGEIAWAKKDGSIKEEAQSRL